MDGREFVRVLKEAKKFMSRDKTRPHIKGVLVREKCGVTEVMATDGHVVFWYTKETPNESGASHKILDPAEVLKIMPPKSGLQVKIDSLPGVEGRFPNIEVGIPRIQLSEVTLGTEGLKAFSDTPKTMASLNPKTKVVRLDVVGEGVSLLVKNVRLAPGFLRSYPLEVTHRVGEDLRSIGFNGALLTQCMKTICALGTEEVSWGFSSKTGLSTLRSGPILVGVMPMRVYD